MRFGIEIVNLGPLADPRPVIELARAAEESGWEGVFLWDHLGFVWGAPSGDPWVPLAALAVVTERLKLGTAISPLPRYRPEMLARQLATLDLLSGGRVVLGAGLGGVAHEDTAFGRSADPRQQGSMVDEALLLLDRLWSGEEVTHRGDHYLADGVTLAPLPIQRPRIPIWIGGESDAALRRAARWDGWVVGGVERDGGMRLSPEQMKAKITKIRHHRTATAPFEIAMTGYSTAAGDTSSVLEFAHAGVTWWLESLHGYRGTHDRLLERVRAGPPRLGSDASSGGR